ncbi:Polypeptide release factor (eRF1) in translation termination [Boothiomyces macroporosus]|uniref:Polypeptide release factor (ERF1) in translation termination n=1 Tax=Boothiomyces macroporosus TaxID=261099 RepID=A0AAD5UF19_9FUNG|nr:Polypeptide release factor (eRF1) in translation termination [Boothiomyces macroporosus]
MSTNNQFLLSICDYRMTYFGCTDALKYKLAIADIALMALNVVGFIVLGYCLIRRLVIAGGFSHKQIHKIWVSVDTLCLLCMVYQVLRFIFLYNVRGTALLDNTVTADVIQKAITMGIFLEYFYYLCGVISANLILVGLISAATGTNLYADFKIGERTVAPDRALKIIRLLIVILTLISSILWATLGLQQDLQTYTVMRRFSYGIAAFAVLFISFPTLTFFGGKVLKLYKNAANASLSNLETTTNTHTIDNDPVKSTKLQPKRKKKAKMIKWIVNMFRFFLYIPTGIACLMYIVGFEWQLFQDSEDLTLGIKVLVDVYVWASFRSEGTTLITVVIPSGGQIHRHAQKLTEEYGTSSNIKSRKTRLAVQSALVSMKEKLKQYKSLPPNGLVLYSGTANTEKIITAIEPIKPLGRSYYQCDKVFHTDFLKDMLSSQEIFGFVVLDGNGYLFATVSGNDRDILAQSKVDLPNKHGRGGQSQNRYDRLRKEARHNFVTKTAEKATELFISDDKCNVAGVIVAGHAEFKTAFIQSGKLDDRIRERVLSVVDISYGGLQGLKEAINLCSDILSNVKLVNEVKLLKAYFGEIKSGTSKYTFGIKDTFIGLQSGAVETLIVYEDLDIWRVAFNSKDGEIVKYLSLGEMNDLNSPATTCTLEVAIQEKLVDWILENHSQFGCSLALVSDKSQEGSQFVRGIGGIGSILRYAVNFEQFEEEYSD